MDLLINDNIFRNNTDWFYSLFCTLISISNSEFVSNNNDLINLLYSNIEILNSDILSNNGNINLNEFTYSY